jgi:hypothetical protein
MIKVFGGEWRGLGKKEKHQGMILEFEFRKYLKEFKGARLAVFMCIALHCDENGECYPSYDLIEDETGLTRGTIGTAINDLCELVIEGHRVLHRFRERDTAGKYIGSNHYLVFPTDEEVQSIEIRTVDNQGIKNPPTKNPNGGEIIPEVNPSLKDNPPNKVKPSTTTPTNSGKIIDAAKAESIYREVTTFMSIPSLSREEATRMICDIALVKGDGTVDYLKRFYLAWIDPKRKQRDGRPYSKTGCGWLDWASVDTIPEIAVEAPRPQPPSKPAAKPTAVDQRRQDLEEAKRRLANGQPI